MKTLTGILAAALLLSVNAGACVAIARRMPGPIFHRR